MDHERSRQTSRQDYYGNTALYTIMRGKNSLVLVELPADPQEGLALLLNHPSNLCRSDNTATTDRTDQI